MFTKHVCTRINSSFCLTASLRKESPFIPIGDLFVGMRIAHYNLSYVNKAEPPPDCFYCASVLAIKYVLLNCIVNISEQFSFKRMILHNFKLSRPTIFRFFNKRWIGVITFTCCMEICWKAIFWNLFFIFYFDYCVLAHISFSCFSVQLCLNHFTDNVISSGVILASMAAIRRSCQISLIF